MENFKDIKGNVSSFISCNVDSIYKNTKSLEINKYVILLRQIARKRIETNHLTKIDWKNKVIKVKKNVVLNDNQLISMYWILENNDEVIREVKRFLYLFHSRATKNNKNPYV